MQYIKKNSFFPIISATIISLASLNVSAEETVITDDGHQVLLKDDGSWVQLSKDRFATTPSGKRIRLLPDGSWKVMEAVKNYDAQQYKHISPHASTTSKNLPVSTITGTQVLLAKTEFLKVKTKLSKSVRIDTRTVYHLTVKNNSEQEVSLASLSPSQFQATASNGEKFKILSVNPKQQQLSKGEQASITVTADATPRWFNVKYVSLSIDANTFADSPKQILSTNLDNVQKRLVDSF